jgi:predicted nucleotidyltransferase
MNIGKNEIINKLKINKNTLEKYGVRSIGLFGSYATETAKEDSDIDILIDLSTDKGMYQNYCKTKYFLEDLFHKEIDLITLNQFEQVYKTKIAKDNQKKIRKEILESVIYV